jgi:hypothetical protein
MRLDQRYRSAFLFLSAISLVIPFAYCEKVLISTEEPLILGENLILVAEDIDLATGSVWVDLYNGSSMVQSGIVNLGGHINRSGINVTIEGVYAGDKSDLVAIEINRPEVSGKALECPPVDLATKEGPDENGTDTGQALGLGLPWGLPWAKMLLEYGGNLPGGLYNKDVLHLP